jgi:hypothetical protein
MKIVLKNVRLSFPKIFEATQFKGTGPLRYEASFLVEPDTDAHKAIEGAIEAVAKEKWNAKAAAKLKQLRTSKQTCCYVSGEMTGREENEGLFVLTGNRKEKDGPVGKFDSDKTPIHNDNGRLYGGCYVNASVDIWTQDGEYPGIRCTLIAIQFAKDGDAFGGVAAKSTGDEFEVLEGAEDDLL